MGDAIQIIAEFSGKIGHVPKDIPEFLCDLRTGNHLDTGSVAENLLPFIRYLSCLPNKSKNAVGNCRVGVGSVLRVDGGSVCVVLVVIDVVDGGASLVRGGGVLSGIDSRDEVVFGEGVSDVLDVDVEWDDKGDGV